MIKTHFVFAVSFVAMLAVSSAWATDPADTSSTTDTVATEHTVYTNQDPTSGTGIAGVSYVNKAVNKAGASAQAAEAHAAAAGASALSAADSAAAAAASAASANETLKSKADKSTLDSYALKTYVDDQISTYDEGIGESIDELSNTKQAKSTADYQIGNKSGGWTTMTTGQQNALNSGVTSTTVTQVATNTTNIAKKQDASTIGTVSSANMGTTATTVVGAIKEVATAAATAKSTADGKQAKSTAAYQMGNASGGWTAMTTEQQNALNSGVTSTTVTQVATNKTNIATNTTNIAKKQDTISDLATIRSGAAAGATAVQPATLDSYALKTYVDDQISTYDEGIGESIDELSNTKQAKSTADYQIGNKSGGWTTMTTGQQNALNSGVTSTTVTQVATNTTNIAKKQNTLTATGAADRPVYATNGGVAAVTGISIPVGTSTANGSTSWAKIWVE